MARYEDLGNGFGVIRDDNDEILKTTTVKPQEAQSTPGRKPTVYDRFDNEPYRSGPLNVPQKQESELTIYKRQLEAEYNQAKEQSKINTKLRAEKAGQKILDKVEVKAGLKNAYEVIHDADERHQSIFGVIKDALSSDNQRKGNAKSLFIKQLQRAGHEVVTNPHTGHQEVLYNGHGVDIDEITDKGFLESMGDGLANHAFEMAGGLVAAMSYSKWLRAAAAANPTKITPHGAVGSAAMYAAGVGGDVIGSYVDAWRDKKAVERAKNSQLGKDLLTSYMNVDEINTQIDDAAGLVVVFNKRAPSLTQKEKELLKYTNDATDNFMTYAGVNATNAVLNDALMIGVTEGVVRPAIKAAAYGLKNTKVGQTITDHAASSTIGIGTGTTAGFVADTILPGSGFLVGAGTGYLTKKSVQSTKQFTKSALNKGKEALDKSGVTPEKLKGTISEISPLKANVDIETWAYQTTNLNMKNPEALAAAQGLHNLGVEIPTDTGIGRVVNSMLLAPTSAPFIQNMVKNSPYTATGIRDMLQGFTHAFDMQLQKYLPTNKNIAVATLSNDLRASHANNINALNELANLGRQLTNNRRVSESFALDYWTAINKIGDGKQLTKIGLPSKYISSKVNRAAHLESDNMYEKLGAIKQESAATQVINSGMLQNADFGDLLIMQANISTIDKNLAATIPSLSDLRINLDLAIDDMLNSISDRGVREALRDNIGKTMGKIVAFEGLSTNKLLGKALREKDPDKMVQYLTDAIKEVSIIDSAAGIKQILQVLPMQKRAPMEMLVLKKVIEDFTENLESPGKAVINSAKLRGFLPKVKDQITTPEGKALIDILDLYAKSFGDSAAILAAAKPQTTVAGGQGISQSIMTRLHTRLVSTLTTKLLGWTTLTHAGQMFRASSLAAKFFKEPFSPKIMRAIDDLYNIKVAEYNKGAKNPKALQGELQIIKDIKDAASHANNIKQVVTNNADIVAKQVNDSIQQGKTMDDAIDEVLAQMGSQKPEPSIKQQLAAQGQYIVPTEKMTILSDTKVADLQQVPAETIFNTEQAVKDNILNYTLAITENYASINQTFNQKNFANNIIDSYNNALPPSHNHLKLSRFEDDFFEQLENIVTRREDTRQQQAEILAKQAEEEAAKQAAKQAEEEAAKQAEEEAAKQAAKQAEEEAAERAKVAAERKAQKEAKKKQKSIKTPKNVVQKEMSFPVNSISFEVSSPFTAKSKDHIFVGGSLRERARAFSKSIDNFSGKFSEEDIAAIIKAPQDTLYIVKDVMSDIVNNTVNPSLDTLSKAMKVFDTLVTSVEKKLGDTPELAKWRIQAAAEYDYAAWLLPNKQIFNRLVPYKTIDDFANVGIPISDTVKTAYTNKSASEMLDLFMRHIMRHNMPQDAAFIIKNIDDVAVAEATKNVDLSKVFMRDGKPLILYRGADNTKFNNIKSHNAKNFNSKEEADKFYKGKLDYNRIHDNSIWLTKDVLHATYFANAVEDGMIRPFVLNKSNKLLQLHDNAKFGYNHKYPTEFYDTNSILAHRYLKDMTPELRKRSDALIKQIREDKATGVVFSDDTIAVFDSSAINRIDSKPTNYTATHNFYSVGGGLAGIEQDENGQFQIDPVKMALGVLLGYSAIKAADSQLVKNVSEALRYEPIIKRMLLLPQNEVPKYAKAMTGKITELTKKIADDKNIKYFYGSNNAVGANKTKKKEAQKMWDEGYSEETIKDKTGWQYDEITGQWKFEFDKQATGFSPNDTEHAYKVLTSKPEGATMEEVFPNATKLYEMYPSAKHVKVTIDKSLANGNTNGYFNYLTNEISLSPKIIHPSTFKRTITHELQHYIQNVEQYLLTTPYTMTSQLPELFKKQPNLMKDIKDNCGFIHPFMDTPVKSAIKANKSINTSDLVITIDNKLPESIDSYKISDKDILPYGDGITINLHTDSSQDTKNMFIFIATYLNYTKHYARKSTQRHYIYNSPLYYYTRGIELEAFAVGGR